MESSDVEREVVDMVEGSDKILSLPYIWRVFLVCYFGPVINISWRLGLALLKDVKRGEDVGA